MIEVVDSDGKVWINTRLIQSMRDEGPFVTVTLRGGFTYYVKNTTAAKLARQIAGSDI